MIHLLQNKKAVWANKLDQSWDRTRKWMVRRRNGGYASWHWVKRYSGWMWGAVEASWGLCTQLLPKQPVFCLTGSQHTYQTRDLLCVEIGAPLLDPMKQGIKSQALLWLYIINYYTICTSREDLRRNQEQSNTIYKIALFRNYPGYLRQEAELFPTARALWDYEKQPSLCKTTHFSDNGVVA